MLESSGYVGSQWEEGFSRYIRLQSVPGLNASLRGCRGGQGVIGGLKESEVAKGCPFGLGSSFGERIAGWGERDR